MDSFTREAYRDVINAPRLTIHRNRVPWYKVSKPKKQHDCWAHTVTIENGEVVYICPCGGKRREWDNWGNQNSR